MQGYRAVHGVNHGGAGAAGLEQISLQGEIPLGLTVGIVNEHQPRVVLQAFGLLDHGFLVLAQKRFRERAKQENGDRQIPRGDEVDAA